MTVFHLIAALLLAGGLEQASQEHIDVRVGIVAYEDFHGELEHFEQFFAELSRRDPALHFQLAVGSYSDVLHWLDRRLVDVAVLTPGAFASVLPREDRAGLCTYLATIQLPPATSTWASAGRKAAGFHDSYAAVCLVSESSTLRSLGDLKRAAQENRVEFLFVHPMSVSGRVAPLKGLHEIGIQPADKQVQFTHSHTQSIRMLADTQPAKERVAFVWDDAAGKDSELEAGVRRLPFPKLEELEIPHDVVVAQSEFKHLDRFRKLLDGAESGPYRFTHIIDWRPRFRTVRNWLRSAGGLSAPQDQPRISLDEISRTLLQYSRSQPQPPRLALVLSGGGAKCSYQVGAVAALEEKLAELRRTTSEPGLDIELVVGTSGGAINSVPIAMGISSTEAGRQAFRNTWCALDQREIVRPSLLIRANMGLWFAMLQTVLLIWCVRRFVPEPEKRGRTYAIAYLLLAAAAVSVGYLPGSPWRWLGTNHVWHHIWLWQSFGVRASALTLFAFGVGALVLEAFRTRRGRHMIPVGFTKTTLLAGVLGLPLLQAGTILFHEETLSSGQGMRQTLADKLPDLMNKYLTDRNLPLLELGDGVSAETRLQNISRQVIERDLLKRDLVITGSCLGQTSQELPSDLYFYAPANRSSAAPPYGERGLSLIERPRILLDVVMGSGSIFPVFPPQRIENIPRGGEHIELVDGGFAHNSPVEAAVLWGATHIVLIEATPRGRSERGNFLLNAASSFHHLHKQAQLLDARSRGKVTVFSLSPEPPHLCALDFADNLVAASIERGYRDAGTNSSPSASFRKELGEPTFSHVQPSD